MPEHAQPTIGVDEALARVLDAAPALEAEPCGLAEARGRVLASPAIASGDAPSFDNSAMDGFAVCVADLATATRGAPVRLPLQEEVIAGDGAAHELRPGATIRINTGAPTPGGTGAVVRIEDVEPGDGEVTFFEPVEPGAAIRRAGEDYRAGAKLLEPGARLDARAVGLLASLGIARPSVARRPRVAIVASGDELVEPGRELGPGQIYNSNRYALRASIENFGADVTDLGNVGDTPGATRDALARGFDYDVLVTTGGVSMGSHDFIRPALLDLGAAEIFWKVRQRPGKPLFFARKGATLCFGLPGNPVSVFVTALLYVRAALLKMQGAREIELPWRPAIAAGGFRKKPGLTVFARADYAPGGAGESPPRIAPSAGQGSHQFSALTAAAGLARLSENQGGYEEGQAVDFLPFDASL